MLPVRPLPKATATDPAAMKREAVMKEIGKNMGILGGMAKGEAAYDAAAAEAAKAALVTASATIPTAFETQGGEDADLGSQAGNLDLVG